MTFLSLPSPAKLNLFLHITGQRPNGYHDLQTVFQLIDYCDTLTFALRQDPEINLITQLIHTPAKQNLIYRAATALAEHTGCRLGCDITLNKRLPIGGGVGGGSSNAATTLLALNKLWQLHLPSSELAHIGASLGADIPVFVHGHSAWAEGIGDILTPIILPQRWYVMITPKCAVNTGTLFQDSDLCRNSTALTPTHYQPGDGHNDFEPLIIRQYPLIAEALSWLKEHANGRLTGTGACVFATFDNQEKASRIASLAASKWNTMVVRGLNHSPLHAKLSGS